MCVCVSDRERESTHASLGPALPLFLYSKTHNTTNKHCAETPQTHKQTHNTHECTQNTQNIPSSTIPRRILAIIRASTWSSKGWNSPPSSLKVVAPPPPATPPTTPPLHHTTSQHTPNRRNARGGKMYSAPNTFRRCVAMRRCLGISSPQVMGPHAHTAHPPTATNISIYGVLS